jgi:transcriptional regulator with GAF, ATPase, and Fis domain
LRDRAGRFEAADGGTLFLDEVGEIPLDLQGKLLRVLQEGQFERVGEDRTRTVDVRVVAATNRDLAREVTAGRFRQDLCYRLSVFPVEVPPLRARREDVPALATYFAGLAARRLGVRAIALDDHTVRQLREYDWPGNVRELQNVIERAMILARDGRVELSTLLPRGQAAPVAVEDDPETVVPAAEWQRRARGNIAAALRRAGGKVYGPGGAAELLGMKPTTLASRMKTLGIMRGTARG